MLNESDIKAALFSKLLSNGDYKKNVLINEMVINEKERRADFVLISSYLSVYEIKSDLDSLKRLKGQVDCYLERFDKVTLVVTERHLEKVINLPNNVAIWKAFTDKAGVVKLKEVRRGMKISKNNLSVLCEFLTKKELQKLVSQVWPGQVGKILSKDDLSRIMPENCSGKLKREVINILKEKHEETFFNFIDAYGVKSILPEDIPNFSRSKQRVLSIEKKLIAIEEKKALSRKRNINFSRLLGEAPVTKDTPPYILLP